MNYIRETGRTFKTRMKERERSQALKDNKSHYIKNT